MSSRRPAILMGLLLALLLGYLYRVHAPPPPDVPTFHEPPLAGQNALSGLKVIKGKGGLWTADFDYFYTGQPQPAVFRMDLLPKSERFGTVVPAPERGSHHVSVAIGYPGSELTTAGLVVAMRPMENSAPPLASQQLEKVIEWPNYETFARYARLAQNSPEENLSHAVAMIDTNAEPQLHEAKLILERLLDENTKFDAAYLQLARIAMKSNWSPEGLHQAENLIDSALQIRPDGVDAKILLAYVYAHQHRFAKAEALFEEAARTDTRNLWLWTDWGEALAMQGKADQAMAKYREAIKRPMMHDTYDRARADAYVRMIALLAPRKDLDGMEALYKQRVAEFGPGSCYSASYSRFMLNVRGNTQGAIDLAQRALNQNCDDSESREILGLAHYVKWASSSATEGADALNQAHIFLPVGPTALYQLATSDRTVIAARKLVASGEAIDQKDGDKLTALAYALQHRDLAAARRLLALGARPDTPAGFGDVPVALTPVMEDDVDAVRLLQQAGVDYSKLRYRGATALEFAKQTENSALLDVLAHKDRAL